MNTVAETPPPPERSEQDIIRALQETVSASRLSLFLQCRLKFYFRYVLKLQKPKTASLHLGSAVHAVLKSWNKARWLQQPLSLKEVHENYLQAWADTTEGSVKWEPGEEEDDKTTGWRLCDTYIRQGASMASTKPDAVEVSIEADLARHGLPRLIGILDLVQQRCIIDYKTSASTPNPSTVGHLHEIQTSSYAILYRYNTDQQETGIQLHHLVKLKNPKVCITDLPPMTQSQQTRLFRQMAAYLEGLQRPDFIPSPGMHCSSCEFIHECRLWH